MSQIGQTGASTIVDVGCGKIGDRQRVANNGVPMNGTDMDNEVRLTLTGQRTEAGISLSDFEAFIDGFVGALRGYDRARRGQEPRRAGAPDRQAAAASAFRLMRLEPGSAVATLVAEHPGDQAETLGAGDLPHALTTLSALLVDVAAERELPDGVLEDLNRARRACGDDGAIELALPHGVAPAGTVRIDGDTIDRLSRPNLDGEHIVESISGRLYSVNLDPDRLAIRSTDGVEWACRYDEQIEGRVRGLLGEVVWASGQGKLTSPLKGSMRIERIEPAVQRRQTEMFVSERPALEKLLSGQGVTRPQGLDAVIDDQWVGDDSDERYLAALSSGA